MSEVLGPFDSADMQRALAEAVLMGVSCGLLGALVVPRGFTYAAESLSHALLLGAALALVAGGPLLGGGLAAALVAALAIAVLARREEIGGDVAVGVVFTGFLSASVILLSATHRSADLEALLFGSILTVDGSDLALGLGVTAAVLAFAAVFARAVVVAGFDHDFAAASGIRTGVLDTLLLAGLAAALTVALRGVGTLLVLSLLVAPAVTARIAARRAIAAVWIAPVLGVAFGVIGLATAHYASAEAGPVIALVGTAGLGAALARSRAAG